MDSSSINFLMTQEQLRCAICLDVFTEPVTLPCGHNYCKTCITHNWDTTQAYNCPYCKMAFARRPLTFVNTFISEMAAQFRKSQRPPATPDEVSCDVCVGFKAKAVKSCLVCMCSYCESHLVPHERVAALRRHKLIDAAKNLEDLLCKKHERHLELFCQTHRACVCRLCAESDCRSHQTVSLEEGLKATKAEVHKMIQDRRTRIQEIALNEKQGIANSVQVITTLTQKTKDPAAQLGKMEHLLRQEVGKLHSAELTRIKKYAMAVTLDIDTANPYLCIYDDGKQVNAGDVLKDLPTSKERFSLSHGILGKQSISSGRIYYEVQVTGKTDWDLGVARESIKMTGKIKPCPDNGFWAIWLRSGQYKALDKPGVNLAVKPKVQKVGVFVDYEEGLVSFYDVEAGVNLYAFTGCTFTEKLYPYFNTGINNDRNSASLIISPVVASKRDSDNEIAEKCAQAIADLTSFLEKHKTTEKQEKGLLEKQIAELEKRSSVLNSSSQTEDLIQILTSTQGWTMADASSQSHHGGTVGIHAPQLEKILDQEIEKIKLKLSQSKR